MTQAKLIFKIYLLINKSGVCPNTKPQEWIRKLLYLHSKGWLWFVLDDNKNIEMVAAMYRVPSLDDSYTNVFPEKEEGKILYIPFFVSVSKDPLKAKKTLTKYMDRHIDIDELAFFERNSDTNLKRFRRNKGDRIEQEAL